MIILIWFLLAVGVALAAVGLGFLARMISYFIRGIGMGWTVLLLFLAWIAVGVGGVWLISWTLPATGLLS